MPSVFILLEVVVESYAMLVFISQLQFALKAILGMTESDEFAPVVPLHSDLKSKMLDVLGGKAEMRIFGIDLLRNRSVLVSDKLY